MAIACPAIPLKEKRSVKRPLGLPSSGAWQSVFASVPFSVCATVIGVGVNAPQPIAVAVKFRLTGAAKSIDGGLNTYPARLGVARYTVPPANPPWLKSPDPAPVITAPGSAPIPATFVNVTVTPPSPAAPDFTVPVTPYTVLASESVTLYAPVTFTAVDVTSMK